MARPGVWMFLLGLLLQACATTGAVGDIEPEEELQLEEGGEELLPPWERRHQDEDREARRAVAAEHVRTERHARCLVMGAETLHPESPASPDLVAEHYALYERILREWREETKASVQQAGVVSAEFLATWFISSLALRGGFALFEAAAPRLVSILVRGGSETVAWFRSFLSRVRPYEREEFHRLWMKAQSGELSAAETAQLRSLMARFEKLLGTKLDREASNELRRVAHRDFHGKFRADLAKLLLDEEGHLYPVHHRIPLEYAHLFERLNINAGENLWGVHGLVHKKVNNVWTAFRPVGSKATAEDVRKVAAVIDRHFGHWFNRPYDAGPLSVRACQG